jgi:hypothetical protein
VHGLTQRDLNSGEGLYSEFLMVAVLHRRAYIWRLSLGLIYSEVYGYCLIAMGIESFEWFELDIFGLAKQFFSLPVVEVTFNITTQYEIINNCYKNLARIYITQSLSGKICLYLYNTEVCSTKSI